MIRLACALAVLTFPVVAFAGPGELKEERQYRAVLQGQPLGCPAGSTLVVQDDAGDLEETCLTRDGVRTGYYLRWHKQHDAWALLGRYESGRRHGRWVRFDAQGEKTGVSYYERGRLTAERSFE